MRALDWKPAQSPGLYGYEATAGRLRFEVARAYEAQWEIFIFADGRQLSRARNELPVGTYTHGSPGSAKRECCRLAPLMEV